MASAAPKNLFDVRRETNAAMDAAVRGFREVQVRDFVQSNPSFTYGDIRRELDFYDRAGAYRVVRRLKDKGVI